MICFIRKSELSTCEMKMLLNVFRWQQSKWIYFICVFTKLNDTMVLSTSGSFRHKYDADLHKTLINEFSLMSMKFQHIYRKFGKLWQMKNTIWWRFSLTTAAKFHLHVINVIPTNVFHPFQSNIRYYFFSSSLSPSRNRNHKGNIFY